MSEQNKTKDFEDAVAQDWYAGIQSDLQRMSPGQLALTKKALADFEAGRKDTTQEDFNRRCARATDSELKHFSMYGEWPEGKR